MAERILAGASVRIEPEIFSRYLQCLRWNTEEVEAFVDFFFVIDEDDPEKADVLSAIAADAGAEVVQAAERPPDARYRVADTTHEWSEADFDHLARSKQRILDRAVEGGYDRLWLVDTDLLCDRRTLRSLLAANEPIVSAVFWTEWQQGDAGSLGPNVWLRHPYDQSGHWKSQPEFWDRLAERRLCRVAGGGACCLLDADLLDRIRYHPRLDGLPPDRMWQGEDRTLALLAERAHIPQYADPWPDIFHCYHPAQREEEGLDAIMEWLAEERQPAVHYGDLVSFTVESLDIEALAGERMGVRGRLGGLRLLPELEAALLEMTDGSERLMEIHFPPTWPQEEIRGKRSHVRLRLIDHKEFGYAPVLADRMFQGLEAAG